MVFVWSHLTKGDPLFTLSQVALNDVIMIFTFAPLVALLLGLSAITVPWDTLFLSVLMYIVIPVVIAQWWRRRLLKKGRAAFDRTLQSLHPFGLSALLATLVLLFAFQGEAIIKQPLIILLLAVPILIQVFFNSGLAYLLNRRLGVAHGADRCQQFLRAGGGRRHQPVRLRVRRGAGDGGGRADRGAGDAGGGAHRERLQGLVRGRSEPACLTPSPPG
jgi:ACR3 family arsenite efflux pump ArsB